MKRGFSLMELLVVIGMMALLGGISIGGYRAVVRGMEDRSAVDAASSIVRAACKRAQIDRKLTAVRYWNETVADETQTGSFVVQGRALAIRRYGRITRTTGNLLIDEFGDLERSYPTNDVDNASGTSADRVLYNLSRVNEVKWSAVADAVQDESQTDALLSRGTMPGTIPMFGFVKTGKGNATWKVGDVYGLEFASLTLPKGYIFGTEFSTDTRNPVKGEGVIVFDESGSVRSSVKRVPISALRPDESGNISAQSVGYTEDPTRKVSN
jgi:prepilin-type N-terminal cleavage/methylation domain-containing protein